MTLVEAVKIVVLNVFIILALGCEPGPAPLDIVQEQISEFHELYNSGSVRTLYSNSSIAFKKSVDFDTFEIYMQELRLAMGDHSSSELVTSNTTYGCTATTVDVSVYSKFEYSDIGERFVFISEKDQFRLSYYYYGSGVAPAKSEDLEV